MRVHENLSVLDIVDDFGRYPDFSIDRALKTIALRGLGVLVVLHNQQMGQDMLTMLDAAAPGRRPA